MVRAVQGIETITATEPGNRLAVHLKPFDRVGLHCNECLLTSYTIGFVRALINDRIQTKQTTPQNDVVCIIRALIIICLRFFDRRPMFFALFGFSHGRNNLTISH